MFGRKKKPEPSQEEILGKISHILKKDQPSTRHADAEAEKVAAALGALLFESAPKPPPEPKRDWITRSFDAVVRLVLVMFVGTLMLAVVFGSFLFVINNVSDMNTVLAFVVSATPIAAGGHFFSVEQPGESFKRRKGRKLWRYVLFTFVWSGLVFAVGQEWKAAATCIAIVFSTQVCLPWLFEKAEEVLCGVAVVLERGFRRLTGVPEPPLLLANTVDPSEE